MLGSVCMHESIRNVSEGHVSKLNELNQYTKLV